MDTNALAVVLVGIAALGLVACAAAWRFSRRRTARHAAAVAFIAASGSTVLGLTPLAAVPLLLVGAACFVLALGAEQA